jgi:hypothetical protein
LRARKHDDPGQESRRAAIDARDPIGDGVVEARRGEARRDDHQCEQQQDRRKVHCLHRALGRDRAAGGEHDRRDQRDAAAVNLQPRHAAERHAEIGENENGDGEREHRGKRRDRAAPTPYANRRQIKCASAPTRAEKPYRRGRASTWLALG